MAQDATTDDVLNALLGVLIHLETLAREARKGTAKYSCHLTPETKAAYQMKLDAVQRELKELSDALGKRNTEVVELSKAKTAYDDLVARMRTEHCKANIRIAAMRDRVGELTDATVANGDWPKYEKPLGELRDLVWGHHRFTEEELKSIPIEQQLSNAGIGAEEEAIAKAAKWAEQHQQP